MSPDNYIPMPLSPGGYNRYNYANSNPLKFIDPDGEFWHIVIAAVVGGVINVATNWQTIKQGNFWTGVAYFGAGAASGAVTSVAGPIAGGAVGGLTSTLAGSVGTGQPVNWSGVGRNTVMGAAGGYVGAGVGKAVTSALGPAMSKLTSSLGPVASRVLTQTAVQAGSGALVGGIMSAGSGGNFWDGALQGLKIGAVTGAASGVAQGMKLAKEMKRVKVIVGETETVKIEQSLVREYLANYGKMSLAEVSLTDYIDAYYKKVGFNNTGASGLNTRFVTTSGGVTIDLQPTIDRIGSGGKYPHRNDGSVFKNLPPKGSSSPLLPVRSPGFYREFVHPTPGVNGPGTMRIVIGQNGGMWFTPDHYRTFIPVR